MECPGVATEPALRAALLRRAHLDPSRAPRGGVGRRRPFCYRRPTVAGHQSTLGPDLSRVRHRHKPLHELREHPRGRLLCHRGVRRASESTCSAIVFSGTQAMVVGDRCHRESEDHSRSRGNEVQPSDVPLSVPSRLYPVTSRSGNPGVVLVWDRSRFPAAASIPINHLE